MIITSLLFGMLAFHPKNDIYGAPSEVGGAASNRLVHARGGSPRDWKLGIYTVGKLDGNNVGPFSGFYGLNAPTTDEIAKMTSIMLPSRPEIITTIRATPTCDQMQKNLQKVYDLEYTLYVCGELCTPGSWGFISCSSNIVTASSCNAAINQLQYIGFGSMQWASTCQIEELSKVGGDLLEYASKITDVAQLKVYEAAMEQLRPKSDVNYKRIPLYRDRLLDDQYSAEAGLIEADFRAAAKAGKKELFVEVANEPNLFPYIPPRLYARYYLQWENQVRYIVQKMRGEGIDFSVRMMPGGIGDVSGLPLGLQKMAKASSRFNVSVLGLTFVDLRAPAYEDQYGYYSQFLDEISKTKAPASAIDVANLHFYPHALKCDESPSFTASYCSQERLSYSQPRMNVILSEYQRVLDLAVANSSTKTAVVSEFGSILPYSNRENLEGVAKPIVKWMASNPSILWWNWFKAGGYDSKLDMLINADLALAKNGVMLIGKLPTSLNWTQTGIAFSHDQAGLEASLGYFASWKSLAKVKGVHQSLANADGTLNELGRWYLVPDMSWMNLTLD